MMYPNEENRQATTIVEIVTSPMPQPVLAVGKSLDIATRADKRL